MKAYSIYQDISGTDYQNLINFLGTYAAVCQLVSHGEPLGQSCKNALNRLVELGADTAKVSEWYGTRLFHGETATLHRFPITPASIEFISTHAKSLFAWRWPDEPEDLCFEASDGTPLLISTAHERYAQLFIGDGLCLDEALESAIKESAFKGISGFLVNVPALSLPSHGRKNITYIGIEGDGWPVELSDMPPVSFGMASGKAFDSCLLYWKRLKTVNGFESAQLLYLGERTHWEGFCHIGFDVGYYSNETDNCSLVLNELHLRTIPVLIEFRNKLNRYGLFQSYDLATDFLHRVLSETALKDLYKGCIQDLSIVKLHCYHVPF